MQKAINQSVCLKKGNRPVKVMTGQNTRLERTFPADEVLF